MYDANTSVASRRYMITLTGLNDHFGRNKHLSLIKRK
jgi:hypothetical protein